MPLGWQNPRWKPPEVALPEVVERSELVVPWSVAGLDMGQTNDHCAACVLRRDLNEPQGIIQCVALRRWPPHYDYMQFVEDVLDLQVDVIAPEMNNVGRPVVDQMRRRALERKWPGKIRPVTTSSSRMLRARTKREPRGLNHLAPKRELVSAVTILKHRLRFPDVPEVKIFKQELADFELRYSDRGTPQFGNVPGRGKHDDVVIAVCIAAWFCLRFGGRRLAIWQG